MKYYWWFAFTGIWFVLFPTAIPDDRSWGELFQQLDPVTPSLAGKLFAWGIASIFPLYTIALPIVAQMFTLGSYVVGVSSDEILLVPLPPWRMRAYRRRDVVRVTERVPSIKIGRFETLWTTRVEMRDGYTFGLAPLTADPQGLLAAMKASIGGP